jgi:hypothetical protein
MSRQIKDALYDSIIMDYMKIVVQKAKKSARGVGAVKDSNGETSAAPAPAVPTEEDTASKPDADGKATGKTTAISEAAKGSIDEVEKFLKEVELDASGQGNDMPVEAGEARDASKENQPVVKKTRAKGTKSKLSTAKRVAKKKSYSDDELDETQFSDEEENHPVKPTTSTTGRSRRVLQEVKNCEEEEF